MDTDDLQKRIRDALEPMLGQSINNTSPGILIPMIRKVLPTTIAQDIVGVQPMMQKHLTYEILTEGWDKVCPAGHVAISTNVEIGHWIEQQPVHMWKYIDLETQGRTYQLNTNFFVSDQLLTWLKMRWG